jgi:hypothetical protein
MTAARQIANLVPLPAGGPSFVWNSNQRWVECGPQGNLLINGDFFVNQRVFAGGALSAGSYGYDRWGAYVGGASYSVSNSVVTLASGTICQPIEAPQLSGKTVTVSVDSPSANLTVTLGTSTVNVSGVIPAGAGRQSVTLAVPVGLGGDVQVRLSAASSVTFSRVKLELGTVATQWENRRPSVSLIECQRYWTKTYLQATPPGSGGSANYQGIIDYFSPIATTSQINVFVKLPIAMRTVPAITLYDLAGTAGKVYRDGNGAAGNIFGVGDSSFNAVAVAGGNATEFAFHYIANAELTCTN